MSGSPQGVLGCVQTLAVESGFAAVLLGGEGAWPAAGASDITTSALPRAITDARYRRVIEDLPSPNPGPRDDLNRTVKWLRCQTRIRADSWGRLWELPTASSRSPLRKGVWY